jgi:hypothetical protein
MGEGRGVYRVLVGRSEEKRPRGRPRRNGRITLRWHLREIGIDGTNWIQVALDRFWWRAL